MIDTDKYENTTPERWTVDEDDPFRVVDAQDCTIARTDFVGIHEERAWHSANARLIADAPFLLAEAKRLDAIVRDIESLIPENPDYVCEQILGACHRYMYPEEFGEVIE